MSSEEQAASTSPALITSDTFNKRQRSISDEHVMAAATSAFTPDKSPAPRDQPPASKRICVDVVPGAEAAPSSSASTATGAQPLSECHGSDGGNGATALGDTRRSMADDDKIEVSQPHQGWRSGDRRRGGTSDNINPLWHEDYFDTSSHENPWAPLEKELGLAASAHFTTCNITDKVVEER